jgi:hypothetical protein
MRMNRVAAFLVAYILIFPAHGGPATATSAAYTIERGTHWTHIVSCVIDGSYAVFRDGERTTDGVVGPPYHSLMFASSEGGDFEIRQCDAAPPSPPITVTISNGKEE